MTGMDEHKKQLQVLAAFALKAQQELSQMQGFAQLLESLKVR